MTPEPGQEEKPDHLGHRKRLKDRYTSGGLSGFVNHEVLELLLSFARPRVDTKPAAKRLLKKFGSLPGVFSAPLSALKDVEGVGEHSAILISLIKASAERMLFVEAKEKFRISSPESLYDYCRLSLGSEAREQFRAFYLNTQNELLAEETLQEGTIDQAVVYPRTVVEQAIKHKAAGVLFVHNHPGGSLSPSRSDLDLTRALVRAAGTVGIRVHDHLIVTETGYLSMNARGLMPRAEDFST